MENHRKPCDAERFFKDMPRNLQLEAIHQLNRQKKPPDFKLVESDMIRNLHDAQVEMWERVKERTMKC